MRVSVQPTGQGMTDVRLLDLTELSHIDADGVRLVVEFACRYRAAGRPVTVTGSSLQVEREFEHSAGMALLPIHYV